MFASLQTQFSTFWKKQSAGQKITIITLIIAAMILVPVLVSWATTPSYAVAFSGLSEADAGQISQKLDESSIPYQIKAGGVILVPTDQVYPARLKMASAGLPKSSTVGFELFSGNTLGMTEFTQKVNYQRALEGELQRTIGSLDAVESVSVHIVTPDKALLTSDQQPATASITIKEKPDYQLDSAQVRAITHLVASSVEGLKPEDVVVVDNNGNMLAGGSSNDGSIIAGQNDTQRAAEVAAAADVRKRVQNMLDQILGPNRSTVQAAVSMDWTQRETTSNTYNPTPAAIRSSQKVSESSTGGAGTNGGVPGASSNLPTPVATQAAGANSTSYQRNEETINYELSQTQSHEIAAPGKISRISVSVAVDKVTDPAQLNAIKSAVIAAAGIDTTRGDNVVVENFAFDRSYYDTQTAAMDKTQQTNQYIQYGVYGGAVLLVIILFFYIAGLFKNLRKASSESWKPVLMPVNEMAALQTPSMAAFPQMTHTPQISQGSINPAPALKQENTATATVEKPETKSFMDLNPVRRVANPEDEQRAKIITRLSEENPATVAEIIQIWLNEDSKHG